MTSYYYSRDTRSLLVNILRIVSEKNEHLLVHLSSVTQSHSHWLLPNLAQLGIQQNKGLRHQNSRAAACLFSLPQSNTAVATGYPGTKVLSCRVSNSPHFCLSVNQHTYIKKKTTLILSLHGAFLFLWKQVLPQEADTSSCGWRGRISMRNLFSPQCFIYGTLLES